MKKFVFIISALMLCFILGSCTASYESNYAEQQTTNPEVKATAFTSPSDNETTAHKEENNMNEKTFYIKANGTTFVADFAENSSADALRELLLENDLTVDMHDYGNFEKVGDIGHTLPQNNTQITTTPGDVILYLGTNITIYYDRNSWNFTRLGKIRNVTKADLLAVFGKGDVRITFSLSE